MFPEKKEKTGFEVQGLECGGFLGRIATEEKSREVGDMSVNTEREGGKPLPHAKESRW